ncbi:hypothetical protein [Vulcanisaeta sp. JCM 16161]|uniref:hypothetical protein n=1 Tax=Vulcanisaeta sp. JCM 16161 TaxID=1295372 RepID=UPI000AC9188E|nr:hypothetical protein [Vulcanisaeta sp. JCM 16161]
MITAVNNQPVASVYSLISILSSVNSSNVTLTVFNPSNGAMFNEVLSTGNLSMALLGYSACT